MVTKLFLIVSVAAIVVAFPVKENDNQSDVMKILNTIQKEYAALQEDVSRLKEKNAAQEQRINMLEDQYSAEADTLFLATIDVASIPISDDEPIPWDSAPINPGGHFSTVTGGYTAPYNGYYQIVTELDADDPTPSASTTINIQLTAGQIVRVENDVSTVIYGVDSAGSIRSYFTGFMIYAL